MNQIQANIRVLSDDEIARIHNTSMRILSEIGLHVPNEIVCGMAQKLGAKVDGETVRIPAEALEIAQMAAFYGLTSGSNSALTDALYPDFQAGFEKSFSAVCSVRRSARRPSSRKTAPMSRSSTAHSAQCSTRSCRMRYLDA